MDAAVRQFGEDVAAGKVGTPPDTVPAATVAKIRRELAPKGTAPTKTRRLSRQAGIVNIGGPVRKGPVRKSETMGEVEKNSGLPSPLPEQRTTAQNTPNAQPRHIPIDVVRAQEAFQKLSEVDTRNGAQKALDFVTGMERKRVAEARKAIFKGKKAIPLEGSFDDKVTQAKGGKGWAGMWWKGAREAIKDATSDTVEQANLTNKVMDALEKDGWTTHQDALTMTRWILDHNNFREENPDITLYNGMRVTKDDFIGGMKAYRSVMGDLNPMKGGKPYNRGDIWNAYRHRVTKGYFDAVAGALPNTVADKVYDAVPKLELDGELPDLPLSLGAVLAGFRSPFSSFDMSWMGRQGAFSMSRLALEDPKAFARAISEATKSIPRQEAYRLSMERLHNEDMPELHKWGITLNDLITATKLYLRSDHAGGTVDLRDEVWAEAYMERLGTGRTKNVPILGPTLRTASGIMRASNRNFDAGLDWAAVSHFKLRAEALLKAGYTPEKNFDMFARAAKDINLMTGRSNLSEKYLKGEANTWLNALLFGPKWTVSRGELAVKMPLLIAKGIKAYSNGDTASPDAQMLKDLISFGIVSGSISSLLYLRARLSDDKAQWQLNPIHTMFGSVGGRGVWYNATAGLAPFMRQAARGVTNTVVRSNGKQEMVDAYNPAWAWAKAIVDAAANRGSPAARLANEAHPIQKEGFNPAAIVLQTASSFVPGSIQDGYKSLMNAAAKGDPLAIRTLNAFGDFAISALGNTTTAIDQRSSRRTSVGTPVGLPKPTVPAVRLPRLAY